MILSIFLLFIYFCSLLICLRFLFDMNTMNLVLFMFRESFLHLNLKVSRVSLTVGSDALMILLLEVFVSSSVQLVNEETGPKRADPEKHKVVYCSSSDLDHLKSTIGSWSHLLSSLLPVSFVHFICVTVELCRHFFSRNWNYQPLLLSS